MCGIFAIISKTNTVKEKLIKAIKYLEYRGYDSSGIALLKNQKIISCKAVGKIKNLEEKIQKMEDSNIGIIHTRWATHGGVTENNAHPHISYNNNIAVVHNGIIENYKELKIKLLENNYVFNGQTDSEIISNLIDFHYSKHKDFEKAFFETLKEIQGSYGIAVICKDQNKILIAKENSPVLLGITENNEYYATSSAIALSGLTNKIIQLEDGEKVILSMDNYQIYNKNNEKINKTIEEINLDEINTDKQNFEHFMLKEIFEQPEVIQKTIKEYIHNNEIILPKFNFDLKNVEYLNMIACGTSYYACFVAKYFIEELANIIVNIEIASEFKYKTNYFPKNGVTIVVSQSGETADTIAALKLCKENKQKIIGVVNVIHSNIASLSDVILKTLAGPEIGVASTKAFTAQISILYLFALQLAKEQNKIDQKKFIEKLEDFKNSKNLMQDSLNKDNLLQIQNISKELANVNNLLYIGRNIFYPLALESALKMKEITYIPTQAVAAGELKHGPIALIDKNTYIIIFNNSNLLHEKNSSSIEEIAARNGKIVLISDEKGSNNLSDKIYKLIKTSFSNDRFQILISCIPIMQLLAYYTALYKGLDIDKPRNLAKSVTVE